MPLNLLILLCPAACLQYASNVCGTSVAFFLSGLAYSRGGLPAAAAVGACFEAALLLGSAWYVASEEAAVTAGAAAGAAITGAGAGAAIIGAGAGAAVTAGDGAGAAVTGAGAGAAAKVAGALVIYAGVDRSSAPGISLLADTAWICANLS